VEDPSHDRDAAAIGIDRELNDAEAMRRKDRADYLQEISQIGILIGIATLLTFDFSDLALWRVFHLALRRRQRRKEQFDLVTCPDDAG
jgi:hypothetical protein